MLTYDKYSVFRDKKGYTDYKVSLETGIPKSTFSGWKSGDFTPKLDKLILISKLLDIPDDVLLRN